MNEKDMPWWVPVGVLGLLLVGSLGAPWTTLFGWLAIAGFVFFIVAILAIAGFFIFSIVIAPFHTFGAKKPKSKR
jgi:hypothetical protein